jgi:hypothetical protein
MKIKEFNGKTNINFSKYVSQETTDTNITLDYNFDIVDEVITFTLTNIQENKIYTKIQVSYSDIKADKTFASQSLYEFTFGPYGDITHILKDSDIRNKLVETTLNRNLGVTRVTPDATMPFKLFVPSTASSLDECTFVIATPNSIDIEPAETGYTKNITVQFSGAASTADITQANDIGFTQLCSIPVVTELSRTTNTITVGVSVPDTSIPQVWLEPVYGTLNKTRVDLTSGSGTFTILTTGFNSGDAIRVKLGYKYVTGLSNFITTV